MYTLLVVLITVAAIVVPIMMLFGVLAGQMGTGQSDLSGVMGGIGYLASMFILPIIAVVPFTCLFQMAMFERLNGRALPEPAQD